MAVCDAMGCTTIGAEFEIVGCGEGGRVAGDALGDCVVLGDTIGDTLGL